MPPTRRTRTSGGPALKGSQKTLSFGASKISKTQGPSAKDSKFTPPPASTPIKVEDVEPGHVSSEAAVEQQAKAELEPVKVEDERSPEEMKALKVTDAQIRKYWREREAARRAPRVHQEDLSVEEKVLRFWDMSSQYGPAIGMARVKRWVRANKLGLAPPIEVLAVLLKEEEKGNTKIQRAYVDDLMSSRYVIGEA